MPSGGSQPARQPTLDQFAGALLGCGVGDALGWPFEGLGRASVLAAGDVTSAYRPALRPGDPSPHPPGAYSDDTQQTLIVAESIAAVGRLDADDLRQRLFALWKEGRAVGIGSAFRDAMERLDAGVPPEAAASADLAYNGAAMRVAPVALLGWRDPARRLADVLASSRITHRAPAAVAAAAAIAEALVHALTHDRVDPAALVADAAAAARPIDPGLAARVEELPELLGLPEDEARARMLAIPDARLPGRTSDGVSVAATPTTVASLYVFLRSPTDYHEVVGAALRMGGDVDTFAAIAGGIAGAHLGEGALPARLVAGLQDAERLRAAAHRLHALALVD